MSPDPFLMGGVWVRDYSRSPFLLIFRSYMERAWEQGFTNTKRLSHLHGSWKWAGLGLVEHTWCDLQEQIYQSTFEWQILVCFQADLTQERFALGSYGWEWAPSGSVGRALLSIAAGMHQHLLKKKLMQTIWQSIIYWYQTTLITVIHLVGNWVDQCYPPSWQLNSEITFCQSQYYVIARSTALDRAIT